MFLKSSLIIKSILYFLVSFNPSTSSPISKKPWFRLDNVTVIAISRPFLVHKYFTTSSCSNCYVAVNSCNGIKPLSLMIDNARFADDCEVT